MDSSFRAASLRDACEAKRRHAVDLTGQDSADHSQQNTLASASTNKIQPKQASRNRSALVNVSNQTSKIGQGQVPKRPKQHASGKDKNASKTETVSEYARSQVAAVLPVLHHASRKHRGIGASTRTSQHATVVPVAQQMQQYQIDERFRPFANMPGTARLSQPFISSNKFMTTTPTATSAPLELPKPMSTTTPSEPHREQAEINQSTSNSGSNRRRRRRRTHSPPEHTARTDNDSLASTKQSLPLPTTNRTSSSSSEAVERSAHATVVTTESSKASQDTLANSGAVSPHSQRSNSDSKLSAPEGTSASNIRSNQQQQLDEGSNEVAESSLARFGVMDIDALHAENPQRVPYYAETIVSYFFHLERHFRPYPEYMSKQRDINHNMRSILIDWLVEVVKEYNMSQATLYLSVDYVDRFLSVMAVQRGKLQLVGVTCLLLAAKYQEIYPPPIQEFVYITDYSYTREQVLKMEHIVLKILQFDLGCATVGNFLDRFILATDAVPKAHYLASYLCELTLMHGSRFLKYLPSVRAAAAICLSQHTLRRSVWTPTFQYFTRMSPSVVQLCVQDMHSVLVSTFRHKSERLQVIKQKYSEDRFLRVASIEPPETYPILGGHPLQS